MARITFTLEEMLKVVISNKLLPPQIVRVKVKGDEIHFVINTNEFALPYIPASLRYLSFNDNRVLFELTIVPGKDISWFNQALKFKIPAYMKLEYPKVFVDVDRVLREKNIRGIQIEGISFQSGEFTILTCNI
jgi:hypothetical protein